jgi:calcium permeable stress-gated cation channel
VGGGFLQIIPLVMYYVKIILLGSTPRSVFGIKYEPRTAEWGTLFPVMTQLVVITFGYSIISPIINGIAFAAFLFFYFLYKYLFTWVNDQPKSSDTGGLFFPKAIQHIFVGLYVQQLCLCALFFLAENNKKRPSAVPEGALLVVLIVCTVSIVYQLSVIKLFSCTRQAFFHNLIRNSYGPLVKNLPLTLADGPLHDDVEEKHDVSTTADQPPQLDPKTIDDTKDANQDDEENSPHPDAVDSSAHKHAASHPSKPGPHPSSNSPFAEALEDDDAPADFTHPAAVKEQRIIWLPKDQLGLVHEIERDLDTLGIRHSTEGAVMDNDGHVDVTMTASEVVEVEEERLDV